MARHVQTRSDLLFQHDCHKDNAAEEQALFSFHQVPMSIDLQSPENTLFRTAMEALNSAILFTVSAYSHQHVGWALRSTRGFSVTKLSKTAQVLDAEPANGPAQSLIRFVRFRLCTNGTRACRVSGRCGGSCRWESSSQTGQARRKLRRVGLLESECHNPNYIRGHFFWLRDQFDTPFFASQCN